MKRSIIILLASAILVACDPPDIAKLMTPPPKEAEAIKRNLNPEQLARGAVLFKQNCAACHGEQGQGATNWQKRDKDGRFPPPPLNGLGHTWHHPTAVLKYTINNGTGKIGGNMPAFKDKLTNTQIDHILVFIQEKWPEPIYEAWYRTDEMARNN